MHFETRSEDNRDMNEMEKLYLASIQQLRERIRELENELRVIHKMLDELERN